MEKWKSILPGLIVTAIIGALAILIHPIIPIKLGSIIVSLLLAIIVGNIVKLPSKTDLGIKFSSSTLLELSIIFLAFGISYSEIAKLGSNSFIGISVVIILLLITTYFLAKYFKCPSNTGFLVGFGTTICGSAAIAALTPSLKDSKKEDVAIALAVVNLLGTIGMVLMPAILQNFELNNAQSALLIGGGLHSVGNVAGAAFAMGPEIGEAALTVKLSRVALLTPALIFFNLLVNRGEGNWTQRLKLPWYIIAFIGITIFNSVMAIPVYWIKILENLGHYILTLAMAGIGLQVSFKKLLQAGKRGIRFGVAIFAVQILLLIGLLQLI